MSTKPLSIRKLLLGSSLAAVGAVVLVGGIGVVASRQLSAESADILSSGKAQAANGRADMMHDALRGDVLAALLAGLRKDMAERSAVEKELAEHATTFREAIETLRGLPLSDESRAHLDKVSPVLARYVQSAQDVVALAFTQPEAAQARMAEFDEAFRQLETELEALGEGIEAQAQEDQGHAEAIAERALLMVSAATLLAALALVVISQMLARRIVAPVQQALGAAETVAQGHLGRRIQPTGPLEIHNLLLALNLMNTRLVELVGTLRDDAMGVATSSEQIAQGGNDLSQRTERQAAALEQASATMAELGSGVQQNADQAAEASRVVGSVAEVAGQGETMVRQVVDTMAGINGSAQRMSDIVGLIDSIAFQTNILALNAAVEAARAGEQGRGFAVVASEVRSLATRSAAAAKEIKQLISTSVDQVNAGSSLVSHTGQTMKELLSSVRRVSDLVGEINGATQQQATSIREMVSVVSEMDSMTQQNSALVEESAAAAQALNDQAQRLMKAAGAFRLEVS